MQLKKGEKIVAANAELCEGPGWSNRVVWVHIVDAFSRYRVESIQPEEQTVNMRASFGMHVASNALLLSEVNKLLETEG